MQREKDAPTDYRHRRTPSRWALGAEARRPFRRVVVELCFAAWPWLGAPRARPPRGAGPGPPRRPSRQTLGAP